MVPMDPYDTALNWLRDGNEFCGSGRALAMLILSMWNGYDYPFSLGQCIPELDPTRRRFATDMIAEYVANGETPGLLRVARTIRDMYPELVEVANALTDARGEYFGRLRERARSPV